MVILMALKWIRAAIAKRKDIEGHPDSNYRTGQFIQNPLLLIGFQPLYFQRICVKVCSQLVLKGNEVDTHSELNPLVDVQ